MKYIKLFEKFTKEYQNKIDLKDFKKIKKGSMIQYMGGAVEVVDNNGYVLKLKDDDGKIFTVNKSQFDHGGRISEVSDGKKKKKKKEFHPDMMYELKRTLVSGTMSGSTESLEDRKYELKKDAKGATIGSFSNVTLPKGTIIYNLPGGVFADHFSLKNKYSSRSSQGPKYFDKPTFKGIMIKQTPALLSYIEKNSKVLESFDTEINEGSDQQRLTHLRKFGIAPNNQPQNGAYIKQVAKPGKFFVDWKDAFDLGDVALEFVKSVGSISEFDIIDLKTMKRTGKQLDVKKGQLGNLRTTYGVRVNESVVNETAKPYKKGQRVDYQLDHKGGVGKFADAMSKSKNIESGVIKKRTKGFAGTFKYELTNGLELYGSEIVGLTESSSKDGGDKSNGNSHHDDHQEKSIAQHWKDTYGEEFHSKYPAIAKIIKQRNIKDKRELSRIWQDTYDEDFEEQYPALFNKLN